MDISKFTNLWHGMASMVSMFRLDIYELYLPQEIYIYICHTIALELEHRNRSSPKWSGDHLPISQFSCSFVL